LANATYNQALFRQQYAAVYTYLDAVYLHQLMAGLLANCNRVEAALLQSLELARQGLKPGIDSTQFQSLLAQARVGYLTAGKEYEAQLIELSRLTGLTAAPDAIILSDTIIATHNPVLPDTAKTNDNNPVLQYYQSRREVSKAALKEVQTGWRPHLDVWGSTYARGSGVLASGAIDKSYGFNLSRTNYGLGFQLSFPVLRFAEVNLQKKQYQSLLKSDEAMLSQAALDLQKQWQTAVSGYRYNIRIAQQTQVQADAASFAYEGLLLSYRSGLTDYTRLAQGQYELLNAAAGKANAFVQVWKSLLDMAVAKGDLTMVLDQLK
jgi:outer membrane protein TolC